MTEIRDGQLIEAPQNSHSVVIRPRILSREEKYAIKPRYKLSSKLVLAASQFVGNNDFDHDLETFKGFERNSVLEERVIEGVNPKEIADINVREMARATSQKWYVALNRMFRGLGEEIAFPLHSENGRVKIVIPGGHFAFEVGGILRFFNEQQIPVDIDVVDINKTGQEVDSMDLENLLGSCHSTVSFHPETDASDFLEGKEYDLAILRHPGPVWSPDELSQWEKIVGATDATNPAAIVFSTYNHVIEDPQVKEAVGLHDDSSVHEYDVFNALLNQRGFVEEQEEFVIDDLLRYPMSIYMTSYQIEDPRDGWGEKKMKWEIPVDRYMALYYDPVKITKG